MNNSTVPQSMEIRQETTPAALLEKVLLGGNLAQLTPAERLNFYNATCNSLGLNPLTRPFEYITLNNKLTLYAKKDATEQLRAIHNVSVLKLEREAVEGVYTVTAYLEHGSGRKDSSLGAVSIEGLKGEAKANAMMKAETKAKRRGTLSICGLGILDETEIETIADARPFTEQPLGKTLEDMCADIDKLLKLPIFTEATRNTVHAFMAESPTHEAVSKKLAQIQRFIADASKEEAKNRKVAKAANDEPRQPELIPTPEQAQQEAFG